MLLFILLINYSLINFKDFSSKKNWQIDDKDSTSAHQQRTKLDFKNVRGTIRYFKKIYM